MIQDFNIFGEYEIPNVSVCYPNRRKIGDLGRITSLEIDVKFNTYSEISIEVPYEDNGIITPYYDYLASRNKLHVDGYGYFIIQDVVEDGDGIKKKKTVPAYSEESSFNNRSVSFLEGTYQFYDDNPETETIMSTIMGYIPNWTLASVSPSLWTKYRTFDTTNATLYSFIMNNVSKAYECFFVFDSEQRKVYVKDTSAIVNEVPIRLSYDNVIKNLKITEKADEYVTALSVTGSGDLDISTVNPLGTNFIYDFSYPILKNQMSPELANAIITWDAKIDSYQSTYASTLADYKTINETLLTYDSDMTDLESAKAAIEITEQARIDNGDTDLSDLKAEIDVIDADIADLQDDIDAAELARDADYAILVAINDDLNIQNNFTTELYNELLDYIIESSYQNENLVQTSVMTNVEIQEQAQELYDQGVTVLAKLSQPRFEFSIDSVNFIFLREYLQMTNALTIGSVITVELDENREATPILLEIKFNFYDPTNFSLTFANRYRLDDPAYEFAELVQDTITNGSNIAVDTQFWKDWSNNYQTNVSSFVTSALDASRNRLISATNQQIQIDGSGLRGKQQLESGEYSPKQVWMTGKTLAFTDDAWETVKVALGEITLPDTSTTYGLVADAIVTGTLYASLITILGDTNFYWDAENIVIQNPSDSDEEIRIGKYDGTNYGIGFTTDGGSTWNTSIDFSGVTAEQINAATGTFQAISLDDPSETYYEMDIGEFDLTVEGSPVTLSGVTWGSSQLNYIGAVSSGALVMRGNNGLLYYCPSGNTVTFEVGASGTVMSMNDTRMDLTGDFDIFGDINVTGDIYIDSVVVPKIDRGTATLTGVSWTSVSFNFTFASAPKVVATYAKNASSTGIYPLKTQSVTTTGFQVCMAASSGSGTRYVDWVAVGV